MSALGQEQPEYSYPDFRGGASGYTYTYDYEAQLYILKEED